MWHRLAARPSLRWLIKRLIAAAVFAALAGAFVPVNIAPPPLPIYAQPVTPGPG